MFSPRDDADSALSRLEEAHQRLGHLYAISQMLTHIEDVDDTVRAVIGLMVRSLSVRTAIAMLLDHGRLKTITWAAEGVGPPWIRHVEARALDAFIYFVDADDRASEPAQAPSSVAGGETGHYILLPLVVRSEPVFGALQVEGPDQPSEQDLMFVNAVVNQLATALAWHETVEARQASARARASNAEARQATAERSRQRYEALVDNLDRAFVWEADARAMRMTYVSAEAERLLGYSRERWLSAPNLWFACAVPDDRALLSQTFDQVLKDGRNQRIEHRVTASDGRTVWLHTGVHLDQDDPESPQLQGVSADITDLKQAELTQQFFADIGAAIASSLDYRDTLSAITRLAVPRFADACFFDVLEADGQLRRFGASPQGSPGVSQDRPWRRVPIVIRGHTIGAFWFTPAFQREASADLAIAEEVARRAGLAIDNARLFQRAERESRMRENLLAVVSHDLRNQLGAISLSTDLLVRQHPAIAPSAPFLKNLDIIRRSTADMNSLMADLLDTASIEAGHFPLNAQAHALETLIRDAVQVMEPQAAARAIALSYDASCRECLVVSDRRRMQQVFVNLLGNAIKFTPSGGSIAISAACDGPWLRVAITDTGMGIAASDVPSVFNRFWQGTPTRQTGTGLGLGITRGIIEAHGGRIWLESRLGVGTTVFFTLPGVAPPD